MAWKTKLERLMSPQSSQKVAKPSSTSSLPPVKIEPINNKTKVKYKRLKKKLGMKFE